MRPLILFLDLLLWECGPVGGTAVLDKTSKSSLESYRGLSYLMINYAYSFVGHLVIEDYVLNLFNHPTQNLKSVSEVGNILVF